MNDQNNSDENNVKQSEPNSELSKKNWSDAENASLNNSNNKNLFFNHPKKESFKFNDQRVGGMLNHERQYEILSTGLLSESKDHSGNPFPILNDQKLILRQFSEKDIDLVYRGLSDPKVIRYYGVHYDSLAATQEQMDWFKSIFVKEEGIWWAICDRKNHTFFGAVGFNNWSKEHRRAEIGYWLLPEFWGSGIMRDAAEIACRYAFTKMMIHRIEAVVEVENQKSSRLLEQLNFDLEGIMKECEVKEGRFISLKMYAKLNNI